MRFSKNTFSRARSGGSTFTASTYDTLGLPLDFIEELTGERRLAFDREGFDRAMQAQRVRARARSAFDQSRPEEFEARRVLQSAGELTARGRAAYLSESAVIRPRPAADHPE